VGEMTIQTPLKKKIRKKVIIFFDGTYFRSMMCFIGIFVFSTLASQDNKFCVPCRLFVLGVIVISFLFFYGLWIFFFTAKHFVWLLLADMEYRNKNIFKKKTKTKS
jgi:hypothetical protein